MWSWKHSCEFKHEFLACVGAFQDETPVEADCLGRFCEHVTATAVPDSVAACSVVPSRYSVKPTLHVLLWSAPGGTWMHVMAAVLPCADTTQMRWPMEGSPAEASSSGTVDSTPTKDCMGNLVLDRPFKRIFRETEEAHSGLVGGENKSFIEEAAYIEEEIQELSTRGMLPFEQRVKRRRMTGKQRPLMLAFLLRRRLAGAA